MDPIEKNLKVISNCKTPKEVYIKVRHIVDNNSFTSKESKYIDILLKCLYNSKELTKSIQYVYNYVVSKDYPMKNDTKEKKYWGTGNAIRGMEVSNSYR